MSLLPYTPTEGDNERVNIKEFEPSRRPGPRWQLLLGGALLLAILAGAGAYYYLFLRVEAPQTALVIEKPEEVLMGEPFEITAAYTNSSDQVLKDAVLTLNLPDGAVLVGEDQSKRFSEENLGEIAPQNYGKRAFKVLVLADSQSIKRFNFKLRYGLGDAQRHVYAMEAGGDVAIGSPALDVNLDIPQSVASGQSFEIKFAYRNTSQSHAFENVKVNFVYPNQFHLENASGTDAVAKLSPAESRAIVLTGTADGTVPNFAIPVKLTAEIGGQAYTLFSSSPVINVAQAPLALAITANGDPNFVAHIGDTLQYTLQYKNTSAVALQNVTIRAALTGTLLDFSRLRNQGGQFSSLNNTIIWTTADTPQLANINAGEEGSVTFSVPLVRSFTIRRVSDKNFMVKVAGTIESPTVPPGVAAQKTISYANLTTKVAGDIALGSTAYYYEPAAGVKNSGPYPPRVNQTTQFTVHWLLKNSITDMTDVEVAAKLPPGVRFVKIVKSTLEQKPIYDSQTGTVSWRVPRVAATQGILSPGPEAVFQIEITPAVNQAGQAMPILGETVLTAKDAFTGLTVTRSVQGKDTNLPDDKIAGGRGVVVN